MRRHSLALTVCAALLGCGGSTSDAPPSPSPSDASTTAPPTSHTAADAGADANGAPETGGPFVLTSPAFVDQGTLPATFTCDGAGTSPPLAWTDPPAGTVELALLVTTIAKDGLKWNWVLYGIAPGVRALGEGQKDVGTAGLTSDGPTLAYSPPCSQGPGAKVYTFTLHALSARPTLPAAANQVTGAVLTDALTSITLAKASASASYTR